MNNAGQVTFNAKSPLSFAAGKKFPGQSRRMLKACREIPALIVRLGNRLLPPQCIFCGVAQAAGRICAHCLLLLPWNDTFCERCGQPLPLAQAHGVPCADCQLSPPPFVRARAPLVYAFPIDHVVKALKFRRQLLLAPALAESLLPTFRQHFQHCDALVPVPLHRWRQMRRGFNQAVELCKPLRKASGLRVLSDVLRAKATQSQSGLSAAARSKNLRNAFAVAGPLQCRRPLVVDDVITTGATVNQLAQTLLRAGAEDVHVIAVARADQFSIQPGGKGLNV